MQKHGNKWAWQRIQKRNDKSKYIQELNTLQTCNKILYGGIKVKKINNLVRLKRSICKGK